MRKIGIGALLMFLASTGYSFDRWQVISTGQDLAQSLRQIAYESDHVVQRAQINGNYHRAQQFRRLSRSSTKLAADVRSQIVRPARQGAGKFILSQSFSRIDFHTYKTTLVGIYRLPYDIRDLNYDVDSAKRKLARLLRLGGGGPGPGPSRWVGTCTVVLETIWGSDLQKFFGHARGRSKHEALTFAKQDAMRQCQAQNGHGLTKCTVDQGQCRAFLR